LRSDFLEKGAFLIEFKQPTEPMDMLQRTPPPGLEPELAPASEVDKFRKEYRTMERKGFLVTRDIGCLIPHPQYSTSQQGATRKGHQRAFAFFGGWCPKQGTEMTRNLHGWPSALQISHRCHRRGCCRPDHLLAEEQWRNQKRIYCGEDGSCDCGSEIKCLRRYQLTEDEDLTNPLSICKTVEEVRQVLVGAPSYTIHGKDRFLNRNDKAEKRANRNANKRKRLTDLHVHASKRKQARLGGQGQEVSSSNQPEAIDIEESDTSSDDFA
jgi:hypothetical protein